VSPGAVSAPPARTRRTKPKRVDSARAARIATMRVLRSVGREAADTRRWRGMAATPPNTIINAVVGAFRRETNIPLEIPWAMVITMLAWMLVSNRSRIFHAGMYMELDTWITCLAPSGASKTFTQRVLGSALGVGPTFGEPVSGAAYLDCLAEREGIHLWIRDEWGQFMRQMVDSRSPLAEARDYTLRLYDHGRIERRKKDSISAIDHPVMVFLGFSVRDTWHQCIDWEAMTDGLGQRYLYLVADPDPARPWREYPIYPVDRIETAIRNAAKRVREVPLQQVYTLSSGAVRAFTTAFRRFADDALGESYFRRVMWRAFQFSAIYHLALRKESEVIDIEDMRYAIRAVQMMLSDALRVIAMVDSSDFLRTLEKAEDWMRRAQALGKPITPRTLMQGVRGIDSRRMADDIIAMAKP
jgi:hypothetical protein